MTKVRIFGTIGCLLSAAYFGMFVLDSYMAFVFFLSMARAFWGEE